MKLNDAVSEMLNSKKELAMDTPQENLHEINIKNHF